MSEIANFLHPSNVRIAALGLALAACQTGDDVSTSESTQLRSAPVSDCITIAPSDDAMISNPPKSQNYGDHPLLRVGGKDESLLRFDLSGLPAESQIDSATLRLYVNGAAGDTPVQVHRATAAWSEDTVTFHDFNQQFDPTVEGAFLPGSPNALKSVSLTGLVHAWFTGAQPNYGVLLEASGNKKTIFISGENPNAQYRPALEVCYTLPVEDACDPDPCQNGGLCANVDEGYACECPAGYGGVNCEVDIDECAGDPCQNGGECTDAIDGYSCACAPGYTGTYCEIDIDECASSPCNDGVCTDAINAYTCACNPGFTGDHCEIDIDECASSPCQNGSECTDGINGYTCACQPGFAGVHCELDVDECANASCQNDATCVDGVNDYTCACLPGFGGDHCEINIDECASTPCLNGGTCTDGIDGYTCACPAGYAGEHCDIDVDECEANPCQNDGLCVDGVNAYACQCAAGFTGTNCETAVVSGPCDDNPCQGGGTCIANGDSYACECPAGAAGANCEVTCPCISEAEQIGDAATLQAWTAARDGEAVAEACQSDGAGTTYVSTGDAYDNQLVLTPGYCRATDAGIPGRLYYTNAAQAAACESIVSAVNISAGLTCDATDTCPCAGSTEWTPGYYPDGTFTHCAFTPDGPPWLLSYFGLSFAQDSLSNGEGPLMALFEAGSGVCQDIDTFADLTTMTQYESCFAHLLSLDTEGACDPCEAQSCGLDTLCQSDSDGFLQCG